MRKMAHALLLLSSIYLFACEGSVLQPSSFLLGEWYYVGTFDSSVASSCPQCEKFTYEQTLNTLTIKDQNAFGGKINLLISTGSYLSSMVYQDDSTESGQFQVLFHTFLNKPPQTVEDTQYINLFEQMDGYTISNGTKYDKLSLNRAGSKQFLLYVRNK